jgi:hypothetical protein
MRILVDSKAVVESSLPIALCGLDEVSARRERSIDRVHLTVTTMLDAERVEHEGATQVRSVSSATYIAQAFAPIPRESTAIPGESGAR